MQPGKYRNRARGTRAYKNLSTGLAILSTRYLNRPASGLSLPRQRTNGGVKDLFLPLPYDLNPIRKSAEAFMRSHSTLSHCSARRARPDLSDANYRETRFRVCLTNATAESILSLSNLDKGEFRASARLVEPDFNLI